MPTCVPSITKNPLVRFPSTWRDPVGKPLTDSAIAQYAREGAYGPAEQLKQQQRDHAKIIDGILRLGQTCQHCKDAIGQYMRFSYLPCAGYYCNACREDFKHEEQKKREARRKYHRIDAFE